MTRGTAQRARRHARPISELPKRRKAFSILLSVALVLSLGAITASFRSINRSLNTDFHSTTETFSQDRVDVSIEFQHLLDSRVASRAVDGPFYEFPPPRNIEIDQYDPAGKYFTWFKLTPFSEDKDSAGVHLLFRPEKGGYSYHPVKMAQYGLSHFGNYVETGNQDYLDVAVIQADYFVENIDPITGMWYYDFEFPVHYNETMIPPWGSAMAQGQVISLLSRVYNVTRDERYFETAKLAMLPFSVPVADGGLVDYFHGYPFYEEYATIVPTYTLNGFIYSLLGLYDLWQITGDAKAGELYKAGIETLLFALPFYDSNGISLYWLAHLNGEGIPIHYAERYHQTHVWQLRIINQIEHSSLIDFYIDRWDQYDQGAS